MNITITVNAPELAQAISNLAAAFSRSTSPVEVTQAQPQQTIQTPQQQQPYGQPVQAPIQQYAQHQAYAQPGAYPAQAPDPYQQQQAYSQPAQQQAYSQPQQQMGVPVTAAPVYTQEQLAVAATAIMEKGVDITHLLSQFGIGALTQLPKERYGEFATVLRGLGARI